MNLRTKLLLAFLLVGLVPLLVVGGIAWWQSSSALEKGALDQLRAVRQIKKGQVEQYFNERRGDMGVLVETVGTLRAEAVERLSAIRQERKETVLAKFREFRELCQGMSENPTAVDALQAMSQSVGGFAQAYTAKNIKNELSSYYRGPFSEAYRQANDGRSPQVDRLINGLDATAQALQHAYIAANPNPEGRKHLMTESEDGSAYSKAHARFHPFMRSFVDRFDFYDMMLVDKDSSRIVYSVFKDIDFGTRLIGGPHAQGNLADAYRQAMNSGKASVLVDYERYTPSYEEPSGFLASPVRNDAGEIIGAMILQIPLTAISDLLTDTTGLGQTGESYLVGPDYLMRSDSRLDSQMYSVAASFEDNNKVETEAVKAALGGQTQTRVTQDYRGEQVLTAYAPVNLSEDLRWAMIVEMDVSEAFSPAEDRDDPDSYFFAKYKEAYGYYDLFLINPDGFVFYSVEKEDDYETNLLTGPYKDSNLGKLVAQVKNSKSFGMADFAMYAPSDEPAAFVAQPHVHQGEIDMIVALQLPLDDINNIMGERTGMGRTGETYLVGSDRLMRSDSAFDEVHNVRYAFENPSEARLDTPAVRNALQGQSGTVKDVDYRGETVLAAYAPLDLFGHKWAMIAEIDDAEAFAAVYTLEWALLAVLILVAVGVVAVATFITTGISKPITQGITSLRSGADQVSSASQQLASSGQEIAASATEQASNIEETSSSMEEMASMTRQNADHASSVNEMVQQSQKQVEQGGEAVRRTADAMTEINVASEKIEKIVRSIEEIAFQTKLLALNASLEAADAGEAGKRFQVVADEVGKLARSASSAAQETGQLVGETRAKIRGGSDLIETLTARFDEVRDSSERVARLVGEIESSSREQARGIEHINRATNQMDQAIQSSAAGAQETASTGEELAAQAQSLQAIVVSLEEVIRGKEAQGLENGQAGSLGGSAGTGRGGGRTAGTAQQRGTQGGDGENGQGQGAATAQAPQQHQTAQAKAAETAAGEFRSFN